MDHPIKILVVEDDLVDRIAIRRALTKAAIEVEIVEETNCKSAIAIINQEDFECAFLDYRLPDGNALELIKKLRKAGSKVPLVILTGQGDEEIAVQLMKAGASDYLSKSKISPESLARSLNNAVRIYRAELEAQAISQKLRISEERYRLVVEGSHDGIWDWNLVTNEIFANNRLLKIVGLNRKTTAVTYKLLQDLIHPDDRYKIGRLINAHLRHDNELDLELRMRHRNGEYRHCLVRGKAQRNPQGKPIRMSGIINDITERKRSEERAQFLAEATTLLSSSLDAQTTFKNLANLLVPTLADWCAIDLAVGEETYQPIASVHLDSAKETLVLELQKWLLSHPDTNYGCPKVLRERKPDLCFEIKESLLESAAHNSEELNLLKKLEIKSYICVPLQLGQRIFGTIFLVWSESSRRYNQADLRFAEDLAHRAAFAIDNARLYREAKSASDNLRKAVVILGEQQQQLRTLQRLTNILHQCLTDLPDLLRVMTQEVCNAIPNAQVCFISLHNPHLNTEQTRLTVVAGSGIEDLKVDWDLLVELGQFNNILTRSNSPLMQPNESNQGKIPVVLYGVKIESSQSGHLGLLAIGNWEDESAFDDEDQNLLTAVGEQAAIAIDNARQLKTLEEREERLECQNKILAEQNVELEHNRQQIQIQNLQLLEAARLKSQFLATMSHELRTPMNAIIGFSQLLLRHFIQSEHEANSRQEEWSARILNNGKTLLHLIDDILDLSTIEADSLELQIEAINLPKLVITTVEELRSLVDERTIDLKVKIELENPITFNDPIRLRQIMINLISNAIKFTDVGEVAISVSETADDKLKIIIKDTGIGIPEIQLSQIFEAFRQGDQSITRRYAGTGLGLALTQSLIKLMEGDITVESQVNQGSIFEIVFPRNFKASVNKKKVKTLKISQMPQRNKGKLLY